MESSLARGTDFVQGTGGTFNEGTLLAERLMNLRWEAIFTSTLRIGKFELLVGLGMVCLRWRRHAPCDMFVSWLLLLEYGVPF